MEGKIALASQAVQLTVHLSSLEAQNKNPILSPVLEENAGLCLGFLQALRSFYGEAIGSR